MGAGPCLGRPRGLAGYPGTNPGARGRGRGLGSAGSNRGVSGAQSRVQEAELRLTPKTVGLREAGGSPCYGCDLYSRRRMLVVEVANGCSLVWGAEAVQVLRERLGVGGRTVGSLPRGPRQNSRLGLPLLLMPEEARLLAEIGAVTLVSAPRTDPCLVRGWPGSANSLDLREQRLETRVEGVWESWILE